MGRSHEDPTGYLPLTHVVYHVLLAVVNRPLYGYAIIKDVERRTNGDTILETGTVYGAIRRLVRQGLVEETAPSGEGDTRRRYYAVTPLGSRVLRAESERLMGLVELARAARVLPAAPRAARGRFAKSDPGVSSDPVVSKHGALRAPPLGLHRSEALEVGFRRVLLEQFDVVDLALASEPEALGRAVHIARRTLKKIRALLRLIASGEGGRHMAAPLTDLRDAGRSLAQLRHADVIVTVVRAAVVDLPAAHDPALLAGLERLLAAERESAFAAGGGAALSRASRQTNAARCVIEAWPPSATGFDLIRAGIGDWYGRGRRAKKAACGGANAEVFHTWRKRAKDVRHQVQLLSPIDPEMVAAADDLHRLTNLLGDANDLDHLEAAARLHYPATFNGADGAFRFLADRRGALWSAACSLGHELFVEESKDYASRLESYWDVWVTEGPQSAGGGQG